MRVLNALPRLGAIRARVLVFRGTEKGSAMKINYFKSPSEFRRWLEKNHATAQELWVGYYKKSSQQPSIIWPESVDEALCFGWIDGIRKSVDDLRYTIRFTPRRRGSIWSAVNIKRAQELSDKGLMEPAGMAAFNERKENRTGIYSYEQRSANLDSPYEKRLRQNKAAWDFFYAQPPSYRKAIGWWVVSAKQEATRLKRLEKLIRESERGQRLR
jgi:uncharacterized protein YdeI (YjbR/CyaY-like superfamily)